MSWMAWIAALVVVYLLLAVGYWLYLQLAVGVFFWNAELAFDDGESYEPDQLDLLQEALVWPMAMALCGVLVVQVFFKYIWFLWRERRKPE